MKSGRWPVRRPDHRPGRPHVIPGLIDSHIHAIRAGLTYQTEVHWIGVRTLAEALARLRAGRHRAQGIVACGGRRLERAAIR